MKELKVLSYPLRIRQSFPWVESGEGIERLVTTICNPSFAKPVESGEGIERSIAFDAVFAGGIVESGEGIERAIGSSKAVLAGIAVESGEGIERCSARSSSELCPSRGIR